MDLKAQSEAEVIPKFPARINVSYVLNGDVADFALAANRTIGAAGGEFQFRPDGLAIPHITLLMGDVQSMRDLEELTKRVKSAAEAFLPLPFTLGKPYFRDRPRRFVFVDANPQEEFGRQRRRLESELHGLMELDHYGSSSNVTHLTLGYIAKGGDESLLSDVAIERPLRGFAERIQVAFTGPRGTCVAVFDEFSVGATQAAR